jgi:hypothetical protein
VGAACAWKLGRFSRRLPLDPIDGERAAEDRRPAHG